MTQPELLLTNGYTPSRVRACIDLDLMCVANLKNLARNLSRNKAVKGLK